jgi:hypothetical protein
MQPIANGKKRGVEALHFKCNYCSKAIVGPSNSSFASHLTKEHRAKCSNFIATKRQNAEVLKPKRNFFDKEVKDAFDADIFMGKLLKWIVRCDMPFSTVDNQDFIDMLEYLKTDITVNSRRTIMRRLEELYAERKNHVKKQLLRASSKISITCDVWTSKNSLSFFGFTAHYVDENWTIQQKLIAFKYLTEDHDGVSLSEAMIEVLEEFGVADRLLGVTADNASNNTTMLEKLETYYYERYPEAGFSVAWNQVECMAHVLNLGAQKILKNFKQPLDIDRYEPGTDSSDQLVTALSRLAYLCRKIRKSPKLRRLMKKVCEDKAAKVYYHAQVVYLDCAEAIRARGEDASRSK